MVFVEAEQHIVGVGKYLGACDSELIGFCVIAVVVVNDNGLACRNNVV